MTRSRRKFSLQPIDESEVLESGTLNGMVSFLQVPPGQLPVFDFTKPFPELGQPRTVVPFPSPTQEHPVSIEDAGKSDTFANDLPTSEEPTYSLPTSERPTSVVPTSEKPTTAIPTSGARTDAPTSTVLDPRRPAPPELVSPTSIPPLSDEPSVSPPTIHTPTSIRPTTDPPTIDRPAVVPPTSNQNLMLWVSNSGTVYETRRTFEIRLAQDSMTPGEENAYNILWRQGNYGPFKVLSDNRRVKVFQAGYDVLAEILRLNEKSVRKSTIPLLTDKFILNRIQTSSFEKGRVAQGSVYEIFSYGDILTRQRAANYVRAVRNGRAIDLVKLHTGVTPTSFIPSSVQPTFHLPTTHTPTGEIPTYLTAMPTYESPTTDVGMRPTPIVGDSSLYLLEESLGTSFRANDVDVVCSLERQLANTEFRDFDRNAIDRIWTQSREVVPDVRPEEVLTVFFEKARPLLNNRRVESRNGLILHMWRSWLTPTRIEQIRSERRSEQLKAEEDASLEQWRREQEATLSDPDVSEQEKHLIRLCLGLNQHSE